jgi:AcrR family transcriptional regulator
MKKRGQAKDDLILAAQHEFEDFGYEATHSNAIAKRAGYAPQTFYRHFDDKKAIFLAVYARWVETELADLSGVAAPADMAAILVKHHKKHRLFRRTLRALTVTDDEVGAARAKARLVQMAALSSRLNVKSDAHALASILMLERLCDAIAEGEFALCGIEEAGAIAEVAGVIEALA